MIKYYNPWYAIAKGQRPWTSSYCKKREVEQDDDQHIYLLIEFAAMNMGKK